MYPECKRILRALLEILPDTKIVEDCHQVARTAQKSRGNEKLTSQSLQGLLLSSEVFASRGLDHRAAIDKTAFMAAFPTSKAAVNQMFIASNHRLPKKFSQIMNKKLWPTWVNPTLSNQPQLGNVYGTTWATSYPSQVSSWRTGKLQTSKFNCYLLLNFKLFVFTSCSVSNISKFMNNLKGYISLIYVYSSYLMCEYLCFRYVKFFGENGPLSEWEFAGGQQNHTTVRDICL